MTCISALVWFDTHPEYLAKHVASLAGRVDGIVALDGAFQGLRDDPVSPVDQYECLRDAASDANLPLVIYPGKTYTGETAKRTAAARCAKRMARLMGGGEAHSLLVLDGDEWLLTDIKWSVVNQYKGVGTAEIVNYDGDAVAEAFTGADAKNATMYRIFPLDDALRWGPQHFDVRSGTRTYMGWDKQLTTTDEVAFQIGHQRLNKKIEDEYQAYNDSVRVFVEGKSGRIVSSDESSVHMRMDEVTGEAYRVGHLVKFSEGLRGRPAWTKVEKIMEYSEGVVDVYYRVLSDVEAVGLDDELQTRQAL